MSGALIKEYEDPPGNVSSQVSSPTGLGYIGAYEYPDFDFETAMQYYKTIGKVQNAVDSVINKIISRDWYWCPVDEKGPKYEREIKKLEEWEEMYNLSGICEYIIRDWLICGTNFLGISDWKPMQISSVIAIQRTENDELQAIRQSINGKQVNVDPKGFIISKYIDADRGAFGISAFHSIFNANFVDSDIKKVKSTAAIERAWDQISFGIFKKYGSPRSIWAFEGVGKDAINNEIAPLLRQMKEGDRLALDKKPEIIQEEVDGRTRFTDAYNAIDKNFQAGLGSSANRVITEPSAMADAREAGEQDDDRIMGIMEKLRRLINQEIIPRIMPNMKGKIEFRWGKQDDFDLDEEQYLKYVQAGVVTKEEFREMLKASGAKLDDGLYKQQQVRNQIDSQIIQDNQDKGKEIEFLKEKLGKPDIVQDAVLAAIQEILEDDN